MLRQGAEPCVQSALCWSSAFSGTGNPDDGSRGRREEFRGITHGAEIDGQRVERRVVVMTSARIGMISALAAIQAGVRLWVRLPGFTQAFAVANAFQARARRRSGSCL